MPSTAAGLAFAEHAVLSHLPPSRLQKRLAAGVVLAMLALCALLTAGAFGGVKLPRVDAFVPIYATTVLVNDSITAFLLYAQFAIFRSRATLIIASGYLFTGLCMIPYALTFPGVFAPMGLFGGLQSTVWLYVLWHFGFPLFVIAYALAKRDAPVRGLWPGTVRAGVSLSVLAAVAAVALGAAICIAGDALLPRLMLDTQVLGPLWPYVGIPIALVSISALLVLWTRRRTTLDLWLMVVMCLYVIEIPLSYYPTPVRFSAAFYTVRVLGILSSGVVLLVMLHEISTLYVRLLAALRARGHERDARLITGDAVSATIAHEVRQPLTAMMTTADAGVRFLQGATPDLSAATHAFTRIVADGQRAAEVIASIRAILRHEPRNRMPIDIQELIAESLALTRGELIKHRIQVRTDLRSLTAPVLGDRTQLQQVLLNLITNAVDSMHAVEGPRILAIHCEPDADGRARVSVADTGKGIEEQDLDRVFNPLFTTKAQGMGMGLSICRSIVEAHDGRLWVVPNTPTGAVFRFVLGPGASNPAEA
jgi:signal transduction histidine kinase